MRILVTGGSGKVGQYVVRELAGHGHQVVSVDRVVRPLDGDRDFGDAVQLRHVDTNDVGQVCGVLAGCDGVIHLGAIPSPNRHPDELVFGNNVLGTFAVLQAASLLGVRKAIVASSISALGTAYAVHPFTPLYAPVDEAHPLLVQDPYGLSKEVDERTCEMFHRRTGMQVLAYRFHWVTAPGEAAERASEHRDPTDGTNLFWGYVDVRDVAAACRLGMEVDGLGFEPFNIIAADSLATQPTEELLRQYCPDVEIRQPIEGTASAFSIEKARRLLGYEPHYSWRTGA